MKYGTVYYDACKATGITPLQWLYLDMIRGLATANESRGYYAHASNAYYADALCISIKTIQNYSKQMVADGWLVLMANGHRKTTQAFNQLYLNCRGGENFSPPMQNLQGGGEKFAPLGVKNLHGGGEKFSPNNNSYNNNDKERDKKEKNPPPPFIKENREKLKKQVANTRKFNSLAELKEEVSKPEYAEHLSQFPTWQKLNDKAGYLANFAEKHCLKAYGNAKTNWQDDLKTHLYSAIQYWSANKQDKNSHKTGYASFTKTGVTMPDWDKKKAV